MDRKPVSRLALFAALIVLPSFTLAASEPHPVIGEPGRAVAQGPACIEGGGGALAVSLSGAYEQDLEWSNEGLSCHGVGTRFGVGVNFGRTVAEGKTLTFGLTVQQLEEGETASARPVALSIGGNAVADDLYQIPATGCSVDVLEHEPIAESPTGRLYRISGVGACTSPAEAMVGDGTITVGEFSFTGLVSWSS